MLTGRKSLQRQADKLLAVGPAAVLTNGGHGDGDTSIDRLFQKSQPAQEFASPRLNATLRGTGCMLASAIAAHISVGSEIGEACMNAKEFVGHRLRWIAADIVAFKKL